MFFKTLNLRQSPNDENTYVSCIDIDRNGFTNELSSNPKH